MAEDLGGLQSLESLLGLTDLNLGLNPKGAYVQVMVVNTHKLPLNSTFQFELNQNSPNSPKSSEAGLFSSEKLFFGTNSTLPLPVLAANWKLLIKSFDYEKQVTYTSSLQIPLHAFAVHETWVEATTAGSIPSGQQRPKHIGGVALPHTTALEMELGFTSDGQGARLEKNFAHAVCLRMFVHTPNEGKDEFWPSSQEVDSTSAFGEHPSVRRSFGPAHSDLRIQFDHPDVGHLLGMLAVCISSPSSEEALRSVLETTADVDPVLESAIQKHLASKPVDYLSVAAALGVDEHWAKDVRARALPFCSQNVSAMELWFRLQRAKNIRQTQPNLFSTDEGYERWQDWEEGRIRTLAASVLQNESMSASFKQQWTLNIKVMQAKDLAACDVGGTSDPYVKVKVGGKKFKTVIIERNLNPVWNAEFSVENADLGDSIQFIVNDHDTLSSDDLIGTCGPIKVSSLVDGRVRKGWLSLANKKAQNQGWLLVELSLRLDVFEPLESTKSVFEESIKPEYFAETTVPTSVLSTIKAGFSSPTAGSSAFRIDLSPFSCVHQLYALLCAFVEDPFAVQIDQDDWTWLKTEFRARFGITYVEHIAAELRATILSLPVHQHMHEGQFPEDWLERVEMLSAIFLGQIAASAFPAPSWEVHAPKGKLAVSAFLPHPPASTCITNHRDSIVSDLLSIVKQNFHLYPNFKVRPPKENSSFKQLLQLTYLCRTSADRQQIQSLDHVIRDSVKRATQHSMLVGFGEGRKFKVDKMDPLDIETILFWNRSAQDIIDVHYKYFAPVINEISPHLRIIETVCSAVWDIVALHVKTFLDWYVPPRGMSLAVRTAAIAEKAAKPKKNFGALFSSFAKESKIITSADGHLLYPATQVFTLRKELHELVFDSQSSSSFRTNLSVKSITTVFQHFNNFVSWWVAHVQLTLDGIVKRALVEDNFKPHGPNQVSTLAIDTFQAVFEFAKFLKWCHLDHHPTAALGFVVGVFKTLEATAAKISQIENLPSSKSNVRTEKPLVLPTVLVDEFKKEFGSEAENEMKRAGLAVTGPAVFFGIISQEVCVRINSINQLRTGLDEILTGCFGVDIESILDARAEQQLNEQQPQDTQQIASQLIEDVNSDGESLDGEMDKAHEVETTDAIEQALQDGIANGEGFDKLVESIGTLPLETQERLVDVMLRSQKAIKAVMSEALERIALEICHRFNFLYMCDPAPTSNNTSRAVPFQYYFNAILGQLVNNFARDTFKLFLLRFYDIFLTSVTGAALAPCSSRELYTARTELGDIVQVFTDLIVGGDKGLREDMANRAQKKFRRVLNALNTPTPELAAYCTNASTPTDKPETAWEHLLVEDIVSVLDARDFDTEARAFVKKITRKNTEVFVAQMFPEVPSEEDVLKQTTCTNKQHKEGLMFLTNNFLLFRQDSFFGLEDHASKLELKLSQLQRIQVYKHWLKGLSIRIFTTTGIKLTFHDFEDQSGFMEALVLQAQKIGHTIIVEDITQLQSKHFGLLPGSAPQQDDEMDTDNLRRVLGLNSHEKVLGKFVAVLGNPLSLKTVEGVLCVFEHHVGFKPHKTGNPLSLSIDQLRDVHKTQSTLFVNNAIAMTTITNAHYLFTFKSGKSQRDVMFDLVMQRFRGAPQKK